MAGTAHRAPQHRLSIDPPEECVLLLKLVMAKDLYVEEG